MSEVTIDADAPDDEHAAPSQLQHFPDDPVEAEFARLRGETPEPVEEPAVDPDEPRQLRPRDEDVAHAERLGVDYEAASAFVNANPALEQHLIAQGDWVAEPRTDAEWRANIAAVEVLRHRVERQGENQEHAADTAYNEARATLNEWEYDEDSEDGDYEDAVAAQASALLETVGPDDARLGEFVREWAEQDQDAASSWVAQANAHAQETQAMQNEFAAREAAEKQRLYAEQVQAQKDQTLQEFTNQLDEFKKSSAFKTLEPIMQELALRSAQDNPGWLLYRGAEAVDDLVRSALEFNRAETEANIRNEIMGATPFETMDEGLHKFGEEPPGPSRPLATPKISLRNVTPKTPGRDRTAEFKAFLHDDPIGEEFERMRRGT